MSATYTPPPPPPLPLLFFYLYQYKNNKEWTSGTFQLGLVKIFILQGFLGIGETLLGIGEILLGFCEILSGIDETLSLLILDLILFIQIYSRYELCFEVVNKKIK